MKGNHRGGRVPHTLVNGSVIAGKDFPIDKKEDTALLEQAQQALLDRYTAWDAL